ILIIATGKEDIGAGAEAFGGRGGEESADLRLMHDATRGHGALYAPSSRVEVQYGMRLPRQLAQVHLQMEAFIGLDVAARHDGVLVRRLVGVLGVLHAERRHGTGRDSDPCHNTYDAMERHHGCAFRVRFSRFSGSTSLPVSRLSTAMP